MRIGNVRYSNADARLSPTPLYNMSILEETASNIVKMQELVEDACERANAFSKLICLIKVWCRQRGICNRKSPDAFNDFLLTVLSVHLLNERVLSDNMSTQQMFRGLLQYLVRTDFSKTVIRMAEWPGNFESFSLFHVGQEAGDVPSLTM